MDERDLLDLLDRIVPVMIPIRGYENKLDLMLADLRDRKLIACETGWEFIMVNYVTEEGRKLLP